MSGPEKFWDPMRWNFLFCTKEVDGGQSKPSPTQAKGNEEYEAKKH